jgi:hypothetical protein
MNKKFTIKDQNAFAILSGDNNPIHVDKIYSRRSIYGEPVVHARSIESIKALAKYRGASMGIRAAEAFKVAFKVERLISKT